MSEKYPSMPLEEKHAWRALFALCIGFFMILLDQTIVSVATPALQESLNASYNEVIWVTSAYLLTFAVPLLVTGRLGDRFGPKQVYVAGMTVFTLSSLACGFAPNMATLIAARAVQGFGASMLTPQTMSVINRIFSRERRGAALGVWGITAGLAGLAGPLAGGLITELFGWQWIFFINVPIGVLSVLLVMRLVPEFPRTERKIDPASIVLSVVAVFLIVFGLQQGESAGWRPWIWFMIATGLLVTGLFVAQQSRAERQGNDPLMPLELFSIRNFTFGNVGISAMGFVVAGTPLPIMLYLQQVHGLNPLQAGLTIVPQAVMSMLLSPFVGRMADRKSPNLLAAGGFAGVGAVFVLLSVSMIAGWPMWTIPVLMLFLGIGHGFVWAPNSTSTMRDLPPRLMGVGSGVYNTTRQVGSVLGSAAIGAVMQWQLAHDAQGGAAYGWALVLASLAMAVAVFSALKADRVGTTL